MFDKHKLSRNGVQAQALVLEQKVYAIDRNTGGASACRYTLRVKFEDGTTSEISYRVFGTKLAAADVGDLIPVRYDPADRSKIELDRQEISAQKKARARDLNAEAIARGEKALEGSSTAAETTSWNVGEEESRDTGDLRIGDADRELIANVLSEHTAEGRLTTDELDDRLGLLYASQTRQQARAVLAGLPALAPSGTDGQHEEVPVLPAWASPSHPVVSRSPSSTQARRPNAAVTGDLPTDEELTRAHQAWRAKVSKVKADKAEHKRAEATGDKKETFLAFRKLTISRAEEKSARAKFDQLRKRRPDWTADAN